MIAVEELEVVMTSSGDHNHTSKSTANGSIITMTMKNNHLIVEKEERVVVGQSMSTTQYPILQNKSMLRHRAICYSPARGDGISG